MNDKQEIEKDLKLFFDACNDFIDGKFILVDIKISNILRAISNSSCLYDLIAECMINYDFNAEFKNYTVGENVSSFTLPEENHKLIPFVFCLLVEIDSKRIVFEKFLKQQFPFAGNQNEEYDAFGKSVIVPLKNTILEVFDEEVKEEKSKKYFEEIENIEEETEDKMEENKTINTIIIKAEVPQNDIADQIKEEAIRARIEEQEETELLINRIVRLTRILDDKLLLVRNPLKKSNIKLLLDAMMESCENYAIKTIVAIVMSLNHFAGSERSMKQELRELNEICYDFYA